MVSMHKNKRKKGRERGWKEIFKALTKILIYLDI